MASTTNISHTEFREGIETALVDEIRDHCIKYMGSNPRELAFNIELTNEAYMLIGMLAAAQEMEERHG